MAKHINRAIGRPVGFTLIEVMIALMLSSIIFVSSYQVISNLIQYQVRARVQHEKKLDKLLIKNVLSQIIEKGIHQYDLFYRIGKLQLFDGQEDSLQIISRAFSINFDKPGYRVYRLFERNGELFVSYKAYDKNYLGNSLIEMSTRLQVEDIRFEYLSDGGWIDVWTDEKMIPRSIRVTIDVDDEESFQLTRATGYR